MSIDSKALLQEFAGHLQRAGLFDQVITYEPKAPPETGGGVAAAVFVNGLEPTTAIGSLNSTSVVVTFTVRLHLAMLQEPQEDIDPTLFHAAEETMRLVTGDFTLGEHVDEVDLLGFAGGSGAGRAGGGGGMSCSFGYVSIGSAMFRIADIVVPVVIHDAWSQTR